MDGLTNNVRQEAPEKRASRETCVEAGRYVPRLSVAKAKFLLQRTEHQTECLGPEKVKHVSKAAESPDVPLVSAHPLGIDLSVDENTFLLVQAQALETGKIDASKGLRDLSRISWSVIVELW